MKKIYLFPIFCLLTLFISCSVSQQAPVQKMTRNPLQKLEKNQNKKIPIFSALESIDSPYVIIQTIFVPSATDEIRALRTKAVNMGADAIVLAGTSNKTKVVQYRERFSILEQLLQVDNDSGDYQYDFSSEKALSIENHSYAKAIAVAYKANLAFIKNIPKEETLYNFTTNEILSHREVYHNFQTATKNQSRFNAILHYASDEFTVHEKGEYWTETTKNGYLLRTYRPEGMHYFKIKVFKDSLQNTSLVESELGMVNNRRIKQKSSQQYFYRQDSKIDYRILNLTNHGILKEVWQYDSKDRLTGKKYYDESGKQCYYSKINYYHPDDFD